MITTLLALHMVTTIKDSLSCTQWFISTAYAYNPVTFPPFDTEEKQFLFKVCSSRDTKFEFLTHLSQK